MNFSKRYLLRYSLWYILGFIAVYGTQYFAVGIIDQTRLAVDAVAQDGANADTIMPFVWTILGFAALVVIIRISSRLLIFTPGRLVEYNIRNDYYSRLLFLQRDFLSKHESGDLVSRCSNDIGYIRAAFGFGGLQVCNVSITLVLVIKQMLALDVTTTIYLAIPMFVSVVIIQASIRALFKTWRIANVQLGEMSSLTLSSYKGVAAIQNYHAEPAIQGRFKNINHAHLGSQEKVTLNRAFAMPLVQFVGSFSLFVILFFVGDKVISGSLTLGQTTAFIGYIGLTLPPLLSLGWMLNVFSQAIPAMERLDEILLAEPTLMDVDPHSKITADSAITLTARDMTFAYEEGKEGEKEPFHIEGISLDIPPGKVVGIVGSLGCGKSTLLDTLLRLNQIHENQLFLNGECAAHIDLTEFRQHFSFAPQNAFLFSTTLRKNLKVALPAKQWDTVTDARLIEALNFAGFDLDPKQFPNGLETEVGEKGVMLSGGQRQRIALARALLKEASIYVLDDVLSAVDHETEKRIIGNIRKYAPGKSFIIASHRVSAIQWADEILVVDKGRIIDRGTHDELASRDGFYRDIYRYQSEHDGEAA